MVRQPMQCTPDKGVDNTILHWLWEWTSCKQEGLVSLLVFIVIAKLVLCILFQWLVENIIWDRCRGTSTTGRQNLSWLATMHAATDYCRPTWDLTQELQTECDDEKRLTFENPLIGPSTNNVIREPSLMFGFTTKFVFKLRLSRSISFFNSLLSLLAPFLVYVCRAVIMKVISCVRDAVFGCSPFSFPTPSLRVSSCSIYASWSVSSPRCKMR